MYVYQCPVSGDQYQCPPPRGDAGDTVTGEGGHTANTSGCTVTTRGEDGHREGGEIEGEVVGGGERGGGGGRGGGIPASVRGGVRGRGRGQTNMIILTDVMIPPMGWR